MSFFTDRLTTDFLDKKRLRTDPLADQTVSAIIDGGFEERINEVFLTLVRNQSYSPAHFASFPAAIKSAIDHYFNQSGLLPDWADQRKIQMGQEVFSLFGPEVFMLLNLKSLPMCYTCAKGAKVLFDTGRLVEHNGQIDPLVRRLMETAQMVVNVLQPGGLSANGSGIVTVQKVRLIHASIRHFLKTEKYNPAGWDVNVLGEPINQEDLAGTLMSFSPIILSGLQTLKIQLSSEQIEAYSHCWKVIGHLIGLDEDLLSDDHDENWALACKILEHQAAPSPEGLALNNSCIAFIKHMVPGSLFDDVPEYLMWYFFQDAQTATGLNLAEMIGVSDHKTLKDDFVLKLTSIITGGISKAEHSKIAEKLTSQFNKLMLQGYIHHFNDGKKVRFMIPPSLQGDWGLTEEWEDKKAITPNIAGNRLMWQKKVTKL